MRQTEASSRVNEPPPAEFCDACENRVVYPICRDCGEPSHVQVGEALFVHDHSRCDAGWNEPEALCAKCASIEEHDRWYAQNGHGFSCNCGCNGR